MLLAASSMLGILAQRCTFIDDDAEEFVDDAVETEEDEAETAEQMKKRSMMMTRKGSWHSHISQRSREHELSIGGTTHHTQSSTQTVHRQYPTFKYRDKDKGIAIA